MSAYHAVPDGAGKYMVTMQDRWGAWRISQGGLDWRHARTVAKAAQEDGHRGRLLHADGYDRMPGILPAESAPLVRRDPVETTWTGSGKAPRIVGGWR